LLGNHFYPQQKLISKVRDGAKITKKYDRAQTPYTRALAHPTVKPLHRRRLTAQHASFNPAAVQRQIQALSADLLTLATAKNQPTTKPTVIPATTLPAALRPGVNGQFLVPAGGQLKVPAHRSCFRLC
jgi:hypothetical protein